MMALKENDLAFKERTHAEIKREKRRGGWPMSRPMHEFI
jgi:hypothetical protein